MSEVITASDIEKRGSVIGFVRPGTKRFVKIVEIEFDSLEPFESFRANFKQLVYKETFSFNALLKIVSLSDKALSDTIALLDTDDHKDSNYEPITSE